MIIHPNMDVCSDLPKPHINLMVAPKEKALCISPSCLDILKNKEDFDLLEVQEKKDQD